MTGERRIELDPDFAATLSEGERRIIQLYYIEDLPPAEVERQLGMPYEEALRILEQVGEVEYQVVWREDGPAASVRRRRHGRGG
jgi:hypothetical protein